MSVRYTDERSFTSEQLEKLFLSVDWESGKYPERLKKALDNCGTVFTAWNGASRFDEEKVQRLPPLLSRSRA